jgi:hypothetical protein
VKAISPGEMAELDQAQALFSSDLDTFVETTRELIERRGPVRAMADMTGFLVDSYGPDSAQVLAATLAVALVRLADPTH